MVVVSSYLVAYWLRYGYFLIFGTFLLCNFWKKNNGSGGFRVMRVEICSGLVIMKCSRGQGASNDGKIVDFGGLLADIWMF
jgi:hypothetical protein